MKKLLSLILLLALMVSVVSCAKGTTPDSTSDSDPAAESSSGDDTSKNDDDAESDEKVDFFACLNTLLKGYKWNPKSVIPETLRPEYEGNLININSANQNYSNFVAVADIPDRGIGEQWNMVLENISQAQLFFSILSAVDTISTVSVTAFHNYFDKHPGETAYYQYKSGIYSVSIHCTQDTVSYVLDYMTTVPGLGEQTVEIALSMDTESEVKDVRVHIGDENALAYTIEPNKYTFAIQYLDSRCAYFELNKTANDTITGHVYEYLTVSSVEIASIADFYIEDGYLTVVGNKADGMVGFDGSICELYSISTGELLAYEVKEYTRGAFGFSIKYNTLWFDLEDVDGITSVKYIPGTSINEKDKVYVNGSSSVWETKNYGSSGGTKSSSRRFDIEFRTRYFYYYDSSKDSYEKAKIEVPMFFVQEEVFDDLTNDVRETNGVAVSINVSATNLTKLKSEYSAKTELLQENKRKYSVATILEYIENK